MRTLSLILLFVLSLGAKAQDMEDIFSTAEKLYKENNFEAALRQYQLLEKRGFIGKELFYNMGNCYYKSGAIGMGIAYYEKALKIDPADEDIKANLRLANSHTEDKINDEERGLSVWFKQRIHALSADRWTKIGLMLWLLGFLGFVLFKMALMRKTLVMQVFSWLCIIVGGTALLFGFLNFRASSRHNSAVITAGMVQVRSSPSESAKKLYDLHEGAKVNLHKTNDEWYEISVDNENYGWVKKEEAVVI